MIQPQTIVKITDNSGGKIGRVFKVLGGSKKRYAELGEMVVLAVQTAEPRKGVKKKDVVYGVVVRQRKPYRRKDGSFVSFDDNAVVIVDGRPRFNRRNAVDRHQVQHFCPRMQFNVTPMNFFHQRAVSAKQ